MIYCYRSIKYIFKTFLNKCPIKYKLIKNTNQEWGKIESDGNLTGMLRGIHEGKSVSRVSFVNESNGLRAALGLGPNSGLGKLTQSTKILDNGFCYTS